MSHYKELPCPCCGRVWKWAFDKKSEPYCPEGYGWEPYCPEGYGCKSISKDLRQIEILERILNKLSLIEKVINKDVMMPIPHQDPLWPNVTTATICSKCGMEWKGMMGYVCPLTGCPVQFKATSASNSVPHQTHNSSSSGDFDIESLDPDLRSWYYDGNGTKRRKE